MTAHDLLLQLREKGVEVKTSGDDRLVIDAPKGTITEELRSALSAHKADLLQILKTEKVRPADAAPASAPLPAGFAAPAERSVPAAPKVIPPVVQAPVSAAPQAMPLIKQDEEPAASAAAEISRLEAEMMRPRTEEEGRRAEV